MGRVRTSVFRRLGIGVPSPDAALVRQLRGLGDAAVGYLREHALVPDQRILWSPGFNINRYFWIHDGLLATALRLRGAEVVPMACDQAQRGECSVWGGVWVGDGTPWETRCSACAAADVAMWRDTFRLIPMGVAERVTAADREAADGLISALGEDAWSTFEVEGLPIGKWAHDSVVNLYALGYSEGLDWTAARSRTFLRNALVLKAGYSRILDEIAPDRVLTHDGTYLMWVLLDKLAEKRGIPYFTYYSGQRKDTWHYVRNGVSIDYDVSLAWPGWRDRELTRTQDDRLDAYFAQRRSGSAFVLNPVVETMGGFHDDFLAQLSPVKPTALLASNVIWDAAALNRGAAFESMFDWIAATVDYFRDHPEFQLIVKPHPVEKSSKIPSARHTALGELERRVPTVPPNVFLLRPEAQISAYDLLPHCDLGLIWTSTIGLEMCAEGIPIVLAGRPPFRGKGFTVDSETPSDYFAAIAEWMSKKEPDPAERSERRRLSRNYFYLYYFVYQIKSGLFPWRLWDESPVCSVSSVEELLPGANKYLDYICAAILDDRPILGPDRWPPES